MPNDAPVVETGQDLLIKSLKQVSGILLVAYVLVMLAEAGYLGANGLNYACMLLLALGLFCLRIFAEIAWVALRRS